MFVLISYSLDTQVMLILILIDVQYSHKAIFSFEKGSNHQNHSSIPLHPVKKKSFPVKFPIPWGEFAHHPLLLFGKPWSPDPFLMRSPLEIFFSFRPTHSFYAILPQPPSYPYFFFFLPVYGFASLSICCHHYLVLKNLISN